MEKQREKQVEYREKEKKRKEKEMPAKERLFTPGINMDLR